MDNRNPTPTWIDVISYSVWLSLIAATPSVHAVTVHPDDLVEVEGVHGEMIEHCDDAVAEGEFLEVFECGDDLFEVSGNAVDGVGANVGDGGRFTRAPRADLTGPGQWASHTPARATGPNAATCVGCHLGAQLGGTGDGSGPAAANVIRDPMGEANPALFIQRNTPHLFGMGAVQKLAEEMSAALRLARDAGMAQACSAGSPVNVPMVAKGVDFGTLRVGCGDVVDDSGVVGVDPDLVVRPFQWKGVEPTVRTFSRGAAHNEIGLQAEEITGSGVDGDGDGIANELTIADMTAMAVYLAAQPRPVTELELNLLRLQLNHKKDKQTLDELELPVLSREDTLSILNGEEVFVEVGCADCHRPALVVRDPVFSEPSELAGYHDDMFPGGQPPPADKIQFDLTRDLPDNRFALKKRRSFNLGNFERSGSGGAIVRLYGDLKRHDMGPGLAENVDETGHGASVWITKELWGVGSTGQYLHDGRATTLYEAILEHGGEAADSRTAFLASAESDRADVVRFMQNLVLFFPEAPPDVETASSRKNSKKKNRRR